MLQMASAQPDSLRRVLSLHNSEPLTAYGSDGWDGAGSSCADGGDDGAEGRAHGHGLCEADAVLTREWRWLVAKAMSVEPEDTADGAADGVPRATSDELQLLFSSRRDGCSLHTLTEKLAGFTRGTLLLCKDEGNFVFGGWASGGLNPYPAARNDES
eukprot:3310027-Prymnesium_polylepis.1